MPPGELHQPTPTLRRLLDDTPELGEDILPPDQPGPTPDPPWDAIQYVGAVVLAAGAILAYPFSKTIWLAIDLMFRPVTTDDVSADGPIETRGPPG